MGAYYKNTAGDKDVLFRDVPFKLGQNLVEVVE